jgi:transcriptional regulator with XRE-family HTH domain
MLIILRIYELVVPLTTGKTMARRRKFYGRKPDEDLGLALKKWRQAVDLTLNEAAKKLGIKCKSRGAYLCQMEKGQKTIPEMILMKAAEVYRIPIEDILNKAYPAQFRFPELTDIMKPATSSKEIENYLRQVEDQLKKEDKQKLASYATFLVIRRKITVKS